MILDFSLFLFTILFSYLIPLVKRFGVFSPSLVAQYICWKYWFMAFGSYFLTCNSYLSTLSPDSKFVVMSEKPLNTMVTQRVKLPLP